MADERIIIVDPAAQARQQLVADLRELKKNPPDRTVPGGRYAYPDGSERDAHGNVLKEGDAPEEPDPNAGTDAPAKGAKKGAGKS